MFVRGTKDQEHAMADSLSNLIAFAGIGIGKNSFHVVGFDECGAIVLRQKWSRGQVEASAASSAIFSVTSLTLSASFSMVGFSSRRALQIYLAVFARFGITKRSLWGNRPSSPAFPVTQRRACMDSDPEQAADRHARAVIMAIFAVILAVAIVAAFVTTLGNVDTWRASNDTQPGTIGLAKPHPPLDKAPGEALRN
jgi:hypothetical protein